MAGVGGLKTICKDAFRVAGAVQETYESDMFGGQRTEFLRGVAVWSIRSSAFLRCFCMTGAALCMSWPRPHFFVAGAVLQRDGMQKSQSALVRGCQLSTQLSIFEGLQLLEEIWQSCCVFDVVFCQI